MSDADCIRFQITLYRDEDPVLFQRLDPLSGKERSRHARGLLRHGIIGHSQLATVPNSDVATVTSPTVVSPAIPPTREPQSMGLSGVMDAFNLDPADLSYGDEPLAEAA